MIQAPLNTACFYTVKLKDSLVNELLSTLFTTKADTFDHGIVVSIDMGSDIEATNSMKAGITKFEQRLKKGTTSLVKASYNPLYLPLSSSALAEMVEMDREGKVVAVGDFKNPFETCFMEVPEESGPPRISGKVVYHDFEVPHPLDPSIDQAAPYLQ